MAASLLAVDIDALPPPTLNDVLYLVADNGYAAEVVGGAHCINVAAWTDDRLLRSVGKDGQRLQHAASVNDLDRVTALAPFATMSTITDALTEAVKRGSSLELVRVLLARGASSQPILEVFCRGFPDFNRTLPVHAANMRKAVQELLLTHPVTPCQALRVGITAVLPAVVRANLDLGMAQWRAENKTSISHFVGEPDGLLAVSRFAGLDSSAAATPDELQVARILLSHPSFPVQEAIVMSGIVNSEEWLRELATPATLNQLAADPMKLDMAYWAACAVGAVDIASSCLQMGVRVGFPYWLPFITVDLVAHDIDYDPDDEMEDPDAFAPVRLAARRGYSDIVLLESSMPGADFDAVLDAACTLNLRDVIAVALSRGVDVNRVTFVRRNSPLNIAARHGHVDAVKMLCVAGAKFNGDSLPLIEALKGSASQEQKLAVVLELLSRGAYASVLVL